MSRKAVLQAVQNADTRSVTVDDIIDDVPGDHRSVEATLQGLTEAGVLNEENPLGGEKYWWVTTEMTDAEMKQALSEGGAGEVAEAIMQNSRHLGDTSEYSEGGSDIFEDLL